MYKKTVNEPLVYMYCFKLDSCAFNETRIFKSTPKYIFLPKNKCNYSVLVHSILLPPTDQTCQVAGKIIKTN